MLIWKKWWHGALYTTTPPSIFASSTNLKNYLKPTSHLTVTEMLRILVLLLCVQSLNAVSPTSKPTSNMDDDELMPSARESTESTDTPTLVMFDGPTVYTTSDSTMEPTSPPTFYVTRGDPTYDPYTEPPSMVPTSDSTIPQTLNSPTLRPSMKPTSDSTIPQTLNSPTLGPSMKPTSDSTIPQTLNSPTLRPSMEPTKDGTPPTAGKVCRAGYYKSTTKKCLPCPMGQWSAAGASVCISCLAGTHSRNHLSCTDCKPGEYSEANWRECEFCGPGTVSKAKASKCTVCKAGTYAHHQDNECKPCDKYFKSEEGSEYCVADLQ